MIDQLASYLRIRVSSLAPACMYVKNESIATLTTSWDLLHEILSIIIANSFNRLFREKTQTINSDNKT
jgi:hypothetical protein